VKVKKKTREKKRWRVTVTYATGQSKTVVYPSKKKAVKHAEAELAFGANDVEVWDE
jgi:hypothetical protein